MARVVLGPGLGNVANAHFLDLTVHWYVGYCCSGACGKCLAFADPCIYELHCIRCMLEKCLYD